MAARLPRLPVAPHPATAHEDAQFRRCVRFHAYLFLGRGRKMHGPERRGLCDAVADARALVIEAGSGNVRGPLVYGFTPENEKVHVERRHWPAVPADQEIAARIAGVALR